MPVTCRPRSLLPILLGLGAVAATLASCSCSEPAPTCTTCASDAMADSRADRSEVGAAADASPPTAFLEGWKQAAWAAPCPIFEPSTPIVLDMVPPLVWGACAFQPKVGSCAAELQVNWGSSGQFGYLVTYLAEVGGKARITTNRFYGDERMEWLIADEGGVRAAWRTESVLKCGTHLTQRTDALGQIVVVEQPAKGKYGPYHTIWGAPGSLAGRLASDDLVQPTDLVISDSFDVTRTVAAGGLAVYHFDLPGVVVLRKQASQLPGFAPLTGLFPVVVLPDAVFFTRSQSDRSHVVVWTETDGLQTLVDPGAGKYVHDVASDGATITWISSSGPTNGEFSSSALYRSPYGTSSGQLSPTKILDDICPSIDCHSRMSGGYLFVNHAAVAKIGPPDIYVVRLTDGAAWLLPQPAPQTPWSDGWVVGSDLYLQVFQKSVQRIPLGSLGTPVSSP